MNNTIIKSLIDAVNSKNLTEFDILLRGIQIDESVISNLIIIKEYATLKQIYNKSLLPEHSYIKCACIHDDIELLRLIRNDYGVFTQDHIRIAVLNKSILVFKDLLKYGVIPDERNIVLVTSKGTPDMLNTLWLNKYEFTSYHIITAAEEDNYNNFIWLVNKNIEIDMNTCMVSGPKVLRWFCENKPINPLLGKRVIECLGDLELCIKLYNEKGITNYDFSSMLIATERGDIKIIKWLYGIGIPITPIISSCAAAHGHVRVLDWLYSMNFPIEVTDESSTNPTVQSWFEKYNEIKDKDNRDNRPLIISSLIERTPAIQRRRSRSNAVTIKHFANI